jgi:hypothetical protein
MLEEFRYQVMPTIRKFVANGGGYIGSCYGSCKSSVLYFGEGSILKYRLWIPTLGIGGFILIPPESDEPEEPKDSIDDFFCNQTIVNASHPVTYGLGPIVKDYSSIHGLKVVGPNAQTLALYPDNTPCWVSNIYKKGKVISFGSHPEIIAFFEEEFNGRHVMSNTWFHLTNKGIFDIVCTKSVNLSIINSVFENTSNLVNSSIEPAQLFDSIRDNINQSLSKLNSLKSKIFDIKSILEQFDNNDSYIISITKLTNKAVGNTNLSAYGAKNVSCALIQQYLKKITELLFSIERIYFLLEDELNITEATNLFIENITSKINYIKNLTLKAQEDAEKAEGSLIKYKNNNWFIPRIKQFYIKEMLMRVLEKTLDLSTKVFQAYNEALKFLRHNWYDYETNLVLN